MKKILALTIAILLLNIKLFSQDYQVERGNRAFIMRGDSVCFLMLPDSTYILTTNPLVIDSRRNVIFKDSARVPDLTVGNNLDVNESLNSKGNTIVKNISVIAGGDTLEIKYKDEQFEIQSSGNIRMGALIINNKINH